MSRNPTMVRDRLSVNVLQGAILASLAYCGITRSHPEFLLGMGILILIAGIIAGRVTRPV